MRYSLAIGGLLVATMLSLAGGQEAQSPQQIDQRRFNIWMQVKLKESQEILAALALADYDTICESVDELKLLNTIEGFVRNKNPQYRANLRTFEHALGEVRRHAKHENIEGVTLGFNQLTMSCVNCHQQLRDRARESATQPPVGAEKSE